MGTDETCDSKYDIPPHLAPGNFLGKNTSLINDYWSTIEELVAMRGGLLWLKQKVKSICQNEPYVLP